mgnify:CR=1 FL=1
MTATDAMAGGLPEVSISEDGPVRHLHLGTPWVQGSMNLRQPYALELEYVQRMMGWMLLAPDLDDAVQGHAMQLGLGAGALTKFCCKQVGMCTTAIELNPQVLAVCRHWFRLPEDGPTLRVVLADAAEEIRREEWLGTVDALQVDLYDHEAAAPVLRRFAEQGDIDAQYQLAFMLEHGLGVKTDLEGAVHWYAKAAEQGDVDAQNQLARLHAEGLCGPQDYAEATRYWRMAAAQEDDEALYNLGVVYDDGLGVAADYVQAASYYRQAAALGNTDAMVNLGLLYQEGYGVEQDWQQAAELFRQAAQQGDDAAQFNLGLSYAQGEGVPQDYDEAAKWWKRAAKQDNKDAQAALEELAKIRAEEG